MNCNSWGGILGDAAGVVVVVVVKMLVSWRLQDVIVGAVAAAAVWGDHLPMMNRYVLRKDGSVRERTMCRLEFLLSLLSLDSLLTLTLLTGWQRD